LIHWIDSFLLLAPELAVELLLCVGSFGSDFLHSPTVTGAFSFD